MRHISIFDTTLRDGEQMSCVNMNINDKVRLALALSQLGVDVIEAGFPASCSAEQKATEHIAAVVEGVTVCALARANENDIKIAFDSIKAAAKKRIHVFIATSDIHMQYKLKMSREQVLQRVKDTVAFAKRFGCEVEFSCEDATRSDRDFLRQVLDTAIASGADIVNIADTVGYITPDEISELIKYLLKECKGIESRILSVHCHNDLGLAVSNSVAAILAGAGQVECTVNGLGERAGNAALEEIVMLLTTRKDTYGVETSINTSLITKTSRLVSGITGVQVGINKPIVGKNAFLHDAGIHQHGIMSNRETYEIMTPESVGIHESPITLGKLSGHHAFEEKLKDLDIKVEMAISKIAFESFKALASRKKQISDEDIRALVEEAIIDSHIIDGYDLVSYQTQSGNNVKAMAMITLSKDGKQLSEAAIGEGPIDACFNAINRIVGIDYKLINYDIKAVTGGTDALGEVRVRISNAEAQYIGKGISTDIIESSIKAYINAINRSEIG